MKDKIKIGDRLKKARIEQGLTQAEVAYAVELHVNYYARVERGEETPSVKTFKAIFRVLKVKSSDIFDF